MLVHRGLIKSARSFTCKIGTRAVGVRGPQDQHGLCRFRDNPCRALLSPITSSPDASALPSGEMILTIGVALALGVVPASGISSPCEPQVPVPAIPDQPGQHCAQTPVPRRAHLPLDGRDLVGVLDRGMLPPPPRDPLADLARLMLVWAGPRRWAGYWLSSASLDSLRHL